ncbi:MAG: flagellar biosynthetic protein FliR [Firmicutes bacterium]|nr:flagellar biosynthetic protein FliR [Bacillota bacterium]
MNIETFFGLSFTQILLGFSRASGLMVAAPVFQSRFIPSRVKMFFAFILAIVIAPYIKSDLNLNQFTFSMAFFSLIQELLVGIIIGFMVNLPFYALQLSGYFFDISMGYGIVNILDPNTGTEMPVLGQFNYILALLIFLTVNGHHSLIISLIQSYEEIKPGMLFLRKEAAAVFLKAFSSMFVLGFKIGAPVLGSIFLTDMALGIIAKLIPQINIFVIGFSVKILLGLVILMLFIPIFIHLVGAAFGNSADAFSYLRHILRALHQ